MSPAPQQPGRPPQGSQPRGARPRPQSPQPQSPQPQNPQPHTTQGPQDANAQNPGPQASNPQAPDVAGRRLALNFAACSDRGLVRGNNEDSAYAGPRLLALADGMGGHAAGEVASQVVVRALEPLDGGAAPELDGYARPDSPGPRTPSDRPITQLAAATEQGNRAIAQHVDENPQLEGMGCTLTAMLFDGAGMAVCHVGDSRGYRLRGGELQQITKDDTFVQSLVDEGRLDAEDVSSHPQRSLILKALTGNPVDPTLFTEPVQAGDRYLLCSDGLSDPVSFSTIEDVLAEGSPDAVARRLVEMALRSGGPDNVTVVVADAIEVDGQGRPVDASVALPLAPVLVGAIAPEAAEFPRPNSAASRAAGLGAGLRYGPAVGAGLAGAAAGAGAAVRAGGPDAPTAASDGANPRLDGNAAASTAHGVTARARSSDGAARTAGIPGDGPTTPVGATRDGSPTGTAAAHPGDADDQLGAGGPNPADNPITAAPGAPTASGGSRAPRPSGYVPGTGASADAPHGAGRAHPDSDGAQPRGAEGSGFHRPGDQPLDARFPHSTGPQAHPAETPGRRPRRRPWILTAVLLLLLGALAGGSYQLNKHWQSTYHLTERDGRIVINKGFEGEIFGLALSQPFQDVCLDKSATIRVIDVNATDNCHRFATSDLNPSAQSTFESMPSGSYDEVVGQVQRLANQTLPVCVTRQQSRPTPAPNSPSGAAAPSATAASPSATAPGGATPTEAPSATAATAPSTTSPARSAPEDLTTPGVSCREVS